MSPSKTVSIRPYEQEDAQALQTAICASHSALSPWMPWSQSDYSLAQAHEWIDLTRSGHAQGSMFDFAVCLDGRFAGGCGVNQINAPDRTANLGYWVNVSDAGQGIATRAAQLVLHWAFQNTDLNRIEIVVALGNVGSHRVAEKLGAHRDAELAQRVMCDGVPTNAILYSVVRG